MRRGGSLPSIANYAPAAAVRSLFPPERAMLMASRRFLLLLALLPAAVGAQPTAHTGWYAGGSIGYGRVYFNDNSLRFAGPTNVSKDENDAVYRLFAGYRAHRNFALEAGWVDLGEYSLT